MRPKTAAQRNCSILRLLKQYGVTVIAVADLDQSIFAFRRADPGRGARLHRGTGNSALPQRQLPQFARHLRAQQQPSLRQPRRKRPAAITPRAELPVLLLEYRKQDEVAAAVDALLAVHEPPSERGHRPRPPRIGRPAPAPASQRPGSRSTHAILGIAWAHTILRSGSSTSADRLRAVRIVEKILRNVANVDDEDETALDERWLRDAAYRLAASLDPAGSTAKAYAAEGPRLREADTVARLASPRRTTSGLFLKAPPDSAWPTSDEEASAVFPFATIHSVKGREFATAVVVLPQNLRDGRSRPARPGSLGAGQRLGSQARALRRRITRADTADPRRPHGSRQPRSWTTQTRWSPV